MISIRFDSIHFIAQCSLVLPEDVAELAGMEPNENVTLADANSINLNYVAGNITGAEAVSLLDFMVERVYESSPSPQSDAYACDVNGLAKLSCGTRNNNNNNINNSDDRVSPRSDGAPIRSVTLVNLLVPDAPWSSEGDLLEYTSKDFDEIKAMGLNTVQISVPTSAFSPGDAGGARANAVLARVLEDLRASGLQAILSLVATGDELAPVVSAAEFSVSNDHADVVLGLTLPKVMKLDTTIVVDSVRAKVGPDLALFIPMRITDLALASDPTGTLATDDPNVYGSLDWAHTSSVADIASSSSQEDRSKLFYHEAVACTMRSPIEHSLCFGNKLPIFWSSGFDLSIDDCANKNRSSFRDYGQCDRFEETIGSGWWQRHRASFAARQLFAAERGLGWSFAAWKTQAMNSDGVMDDPSKLLSLREVAKGGLFPDLTTGITTVFPAQTACLNPPLNDFVLGDDTLAPTMAPPPDCGNGWYNFTTSQCKSNISLCSYLSTLVTLESRLDLFSNLFFLSGTTYGCSLFLNLCNYVIDSFRLRFQKVITGFHLPSLRCHQPFLVPNVKVARIPKLPLLHWQWRQSVERSPS